jgi:DNA-binding beta-propeller fold protein YncE
MKRKLYWVIASFCISLTLVLASCGKSASTSTTLPVSPKSITSSTTAVATSSLSSAPGIGVIKTITVETDPDVLLYGPNTGEILVTYEEADETDIISDAANIVTPGQTAGGTAFGVYDSGKNEFFTIGSYNNGNVIPDSPNAQPTPFNVPFGEGFASAGVAYDSNKGEILIANGPGNDIAVVSDSTNTQTTTIPLGFSPDGIIYDAKMGEIFVSDPYPNIVEVISDSAPYNVVALVKLPSQSDPSALAYDSVKGEIFVIDSLSDAVSIISDSSNKVITTVTFPKVSPHALVYDSGKGEIFVACGNAVSVISDSNNTIIANVPVGGYLNALAYDAAKGEVFVSNGSINAVSVISDSSQ